MSLSIDMLQSTSCKRLRIEKRERLLQRFVTEWWGLKCSHEPLTDTSINARHSFGSSTEPPVMKEALFSRIQTPSGCVFLCWKKVPADSPDGTGLFLPQSLSCCKIDWVYCLLASSCKLGHRSNCSFMQCEFRGEKTSADASLQHAGMNMVAKIQLPLAKQKCSTSRRTHLYKKETKCIAC